MFKKSKSSECYDNVDKVLTLDDIIVDSKNLDNNQHDSAEVYQQDYPAGMKEITFDKLTDNNVQYIENPLPVPKRKKHKPIDYDIIDIGDSDFDLQDMTGMDFFDIE